MGKWQPDQPVSSGAVEYPFAFEVSSSYRTVIVRPLAVIGVMIPSLESTLCAATYTMAHTIYIQRYILIPSPPLARSRPTQLLWQW